MTEPVRYRIYPKHPAAHLFEVQCTVADPDPAGQAFSMPAWIPGSYMIREFARHVVRLSAAAGDRPIAVQKRDKDTWVCAPCRGPLTVTYEVYAWDLSVRAAHLDTTHGFFNGTSVFLLPQGRGDRVCRVDIRPPSGADFHSWRVATALSRRDAPEFGFGEYEAVDYDELVDSPVEMGNFVQARFEACGVSHDIVITGRQHADVERLREDMRRICEHHIRFFGEPAPMPHYVFLIMAVGDGYGGLEHRASTALLCSRRNLPAVGDSTVSDEYRTFLGLVSHEYFHTWNVKRIKPRAFLPYDLSRENYTRQLWAFEGITSYYDDLALVRAGLISSHDYLQALSETVTRVWRAPGRHKQTLAESSFDAWTKFYRQDENAPNAIVSYYTKGALAALCLDLTIRRGTDGKKSLDDVMRALWQRRGQAGIGVDEDEIEQLAAEISGLDLRAFFDQALRSTDDLPIADLLSEFAVNCQFRPAESDADKGGRPSKKSVEALSQRADFGARLTESGEASLAHVLDGGAAQAAGLSAGDILVAIDGLRVTRAAWDALRRRYRPGELSTVHAFRRDELMEFTLRWQAPPPTTCVLSLAGEGSPDARQRRAAWLGRQD